MAIVGAPIAVENAVVARPVHGPEAAADGAKENEATVTDQDDATLDADPAAIARQRSSLGHDHTFASGPKSRTTKKPSVVASAVFAAALGSQEVALSRTAVCR